LGFSPDHRTLAVISIGSNSVTLVDTATNKVKGTIYVGRSPHEAFFTPDGRELWVAVRGEDYISVIDPKEMKEMRRIKTANGPGMVLFRPDGRYAFVPSSFTPELDVIDVQEYKVVARVPQASPFSPNLAVSADGKEVWFTLKDTGKTQVISADAPFQTLATLETGPITNHVALVDNINGHFAYITIGGTNEVKVYRRGTTPELITTISTGDLPHGIWTAGDGTRVYVGLENGDAVQAIDTLTNKVIATIPIGQLPQAVVYVPNAVPTGDGTTNLVPLGEAAQAVHLQMIAPNGQGKARASVVINSLGLVDNLQIAASGLEPKQDYQLYLVDSLIAPYGRKELLANFKTNPSGAGTAQTIGPLRQIVTQSVPTAASKGEIRFLLLTDKNQKAVLVSASQTQ
jgi:YVTN family beta-propeller protein